MVDFTKVKCPICGKLPSKIEGNTLTYDCENVMDYDPVKDMMMPKKFLTRKRSSGVTHTIIHCEKHLRSSLIREQNGLPPLQPKSDVIPTGQFWKGKGQKDLRKHK